MNTTTEMPKRRRFSFSLRTLFVVITVLTVWLGWNVYQVRKREMVRQYIVNSGQAGLVLGPPEKPWKSLPIMWRLLGVEPVQTLRLEGSVTYRRGSQRNRGLVSRSRHPFLKLPSGNFKLYHYRPASLRRYLYSCLNKSCLFRLASVNHRFRHTPSRLTNLANRGILSETYLSPILRCSKRVVVARRLKFNPACMRVLVEQSQQWLVRHIPQVIGQQEADHSHSVFLRVLKLHFIRYWLLLIVCTEITE